MRRNATTCVCVCVCVCVARNHVSFVCVHAYVCAYVCADVCLCVHMGGCRWKERGHEGSREIAHKLDLLPHFRLFRNSALKKVSHSFPPPGTHAHVDAYSGPERAQGRGSERRKTEGRRQQQRGVGSSTRSTRTPGHVPCVACAHVWRVRVCRACTRYSGCLHAMPKRHA